MISFSSRGVGHLGCTILPYDGFFGVMGVKYVMGNERIALYGTDVHNPMLAVCIPYDEQAPSAGNGTMVAFPVPTLSVLHEIYQISEDKGGAKDGAPGPRLADSPTHYAYVRDPAGNKLAFYCEDPTA